MTTTTGNIKIYPSTALSKLRVLWTIARKDWSIYWRYPLNAVSTILQPIVWLVPAFFMGVAFSQDGKALGFAGYSGTTDYMSFILIGTALNSFINAVFWGMGYSMKEDMDAGVLEANWLAPIPRPLMLIGRTMANLLITTLTSLVTLFLAALLFGLNITGSVLPALGAILPMLIGLYGFGFAFAALVLVLREANTLVDVSSFLVQIFAGANFPVSALPRWMLPASLILPLTYGYDAARGFLLNTRTILPIHIEIVILIVGMFFFVTFGLWAFRRLERGVRIRGTFNQY